jgi:hypothetical protein
VGELSVLTAVAAHGDRLAPQGPADEDRKHGVGPHAGAIGGAEPQGHDRQALEGVVGQQHLLARQLRDVVRVVGIRGVLLVQRLVLRVPVDLPGRCIDEPPHALGEAGLGDVGAADDVEFGGQGRLLGREVDVADAGQMQHRVGTAERLPQVVHRRERTLVPPHAGNAEFAGNVGHVQHHALVPGRPRRHGHVAAEEPCASRDDDLHERPVFR